MDVSERVLIPLQRERERERERKGGVPHFCRIKSFQGILELVSMFVCVCVCVSVCARVFV